jgi:hypothetical protein
MTRDLYTGVEVGAEGHSVRTLESITSGFQGARKAAKAVGSGDQEDKMMVGGSGSRRRQGQSKDGTEIRVGVEASTIGSLGSSARNKPYNHIPVSSIVGSSDPTQCSVVC